MKFMFYITVIILLETVLRIFISFLTDLILKIDNQLFICVYFDGVIFIIIVGCIFECHQQIAMRFNRNVSVDDMKK